MSKAKKEIKSTNLRLPIDTWLFVKKASADQEISMAEFITNCIERYRKKLENKLK